MGFFPQPKPASRLEDRIADDRLRVIDEDARVARGATMRRTGSTAFMDGGCSMSLCKKCGSKFILGPKFHAATFPLYQERLGYTCGQCGFAWSTPTRDAPSSTTSTATTMSDEEKNFPDPDYGL